MKNLNLNHLSFQKESIVELNTATLQSIDSGAASTTTISTTSNVIVQLTILITMTTVTF